MSRTCLPVLLVLAACGSPAPAPAPAPTPTPIPSVPPAPALPTIDWARHGLADAGCFAIRDLATGEERVSDPARCDRPRRPNSTFKIANALIGVDLGLLEGPDAPLPWDRDAYPFEAGDPAAWNGDHTLRSGMEVSAVPHFRTLAAQIGGERMAGYLARLDYGNHDVSGGPDLFWLRGGLRISARQQLDFVQRLVADDLPVSARAHAVVREVLLREERGAARVFGKTGSGRIEEPTGDDDRTFHGWLVGWIEQPGKTWLFAMWVEADGYEAMRVRRQATLDGVLADLGLPTADPAR